MWCNGMEWTFIECSECPSRPYPSSSESPSHFGSPSLSQMQILSRRALRPWPALIGRLPPWDPPRSVFPQRQRYISCMPRSSRPGTLQCGSQVLRRTGQSRQDREHGWWSRSARARSASKSWAPRMISIARPIPTCRARRWVPGNERLLWTVAFSEITFIKFFTNQSSVLHMCDPLLCDHLRWRHQTRVSKR